MGTSSAVAFGQYLRALRTRRGLSLDRVCESMRGSPETIDKGALSRLERGQQIPSIFKLGPLIRVYAVSAEALIERMELDCEIERLGAPETAGMTYDELLRLGGAALVQKNRKLEAYAYFREAAPLAGEDKRIAAWINLITAIRSLGKNRLALHELGELEGCRLLDPAHRAIVHERISNCHRCLGDMRRAEESAEAAISRARADGDARTLAFALAARGNAALDQEQWERASQHLKLAVATYRQSEGQECLLLPSPSFEAHTLLLLAESEEKIGNAARARRFVLVAKRLGRERRLPLVLANSELILGRIDDEAGAGERALQRFRRAASMAARDGNQKVAFAAEFEVLCQANRAGESARARASVRRLERLAPWIPPHTLALRRFKTLMAQDPVLNPHTSKGDGDGKNSSALRLGDSDRPRAATNPHRPRNRPRTPV